MSALLFAGLLLGLASSLHCAAMCGPVTLALHGPRQRGSGRPVPVVPKIAIHHAGRVSMYAVAGVAAGAAGHAITALGAGRVLAWAGGVLLLLTAAAHLGVGPALPGVPLARIVGRVARASRSVWQAHPVAGAFAGGILNAWLPCGMVYAALTAAAALGRPGAGMAFMALFGLGTVPALAAVWLLAGLVTPAMARAFRFGTPVALVIVGLLLIARGYAGSAPDPGDAAEPHVHGMLRAGS
jgi:sulfite exporter TauE/SafE